MQGEQLTRRTLAHQLLEITSSLEMKNVMMATMSRATAVMTQALSSLAMFALTILIDLLAMGSCLKRVTVCSQMLSRRETT